MNLQHEDLEDFEPLVKDIFNIALKSGLGTLKTNINDANLLNNNEFMRDDKLMKKFIINCHKGYDLAQKKIADEIIRLISLKSREEIEFKKYRKQNTRADSLKYKEYISVINNRILVLRRIIDAIAFILIDFKPWIARRFILLDRIRDIDVKAIRSNLFEARLRNRQDRLTFSLVNDLSTYIDVGDILHFNLRKSPREFKLIEIKGGKINKILEDIIEDKEKSAQLDFVNNIGKSISKYAPQQASRMIRQKLRMHEVRKIISEGKGTDIRFNESIVLSKKETTFIGYHQFIIKNLNEARVHNYSVSLIDDCLYVIAARKSGSHALHLLYHFVFPQNECKLSNGSLQDIEEEKKKLLSFAKSSFLIDLVRSNIYARSSPPFFFIRNLDEDFIFDLLFGRLRILIFLDIERFAELISYHGFSFELLSKRETEKIRKDLGRYSLPLYDNRAIQLKFPNGTDCTILEGTLEKIFFEFLRPTELIHLWETEPPIVDKH